MTPPRLSMREPLARTGLTGVALDVAIAMEEYNGSLVVTTNSAACMLSCITASGRRLPDEMFDDGVFRALNAAGLIRNDSVGLFTGGDTRGEWFLRRAVTRWTFYDLGSPYGSSMMDRRLITALQDSPETLRIATLMKRSGWPVVRYGTNATVPCMLQSRGPGAGRPWLEVDIFSLEVLTHWTDWLMLRSENPHTYKLRSSFDPLQAAYDTPLPRRAESMCGLGY